jgi:hypothetical protein
MTTMTTEPEDLTPEERAALDSLPRDRSPGRLLEERVVRALRARGVLRRRSPAPAWVAAGLAASVALFAGGFAAGQWTSSRGMARSFRDAQVQSAREAAAVVQRTGSAYINALAALALYADSGGNGAVRQGREAALAALSAAAAELADLDPSDPVARSVRVLLAAHEQPTVERARARAVLWF